METRQDRQISLIITWTKGGGEGGGEGGIDWIL
jgi:hypothetical protein